MKLYVVVIGEYSDARVWGVFSTEEKAQAFVDACGKGGDIQEHTLDEYTPAVSQGLKPYVVTLKADGDLDWISAGSFLMETVTIPRTDIRGECGKQSHLWARDENHAVKIAMERFMMDKAMERTDAK